MSTSRVSRLAVVALLSAVVLLPLPGCGVFSARAQVRGNKVDPDALGELVPGVSTKADASSLLGSPTLHASFDDNTWLYIGQLTRPVIGGTQHIMQQEVVALSFDQGGVLRDVQTLGKKDSLPVAVIARETPSPGSSASFMQQLLGNVGKFNAGGNQQNTAGTADSGESARFSTGQ